LRPDFDEETAQLLAQVGVRKTQIGIEAFSSTLLRRLGKGVLTIDNINCLKLCEEYAIPYQYNLLIEVPGLTCCEVSETLSVLPLLYHLKPPNIVPFYLSRGSRMYQSPEKFGIEPNSLDRIPCCYLPKFLANSKVNHEVSYRCVDLNTTHPNWGEVIEMGKNWQKNYRNIKSCFGENHQILSYKEGGNFISITDERSGSQKSFILEGLTREVFLKCQRVVAFYTLQKQLPDISKKTLTQVVEQLAGEGLIYLEGSRLLSLPIRECLPNGLPRSMIQC
jgi:radical SAM superfamily enzyme YgiQ (UPF0313 family)